MTGEQWKHAVNYFNYLKTLIENDQILLTNGGSPNSADQYDILVVKVYEGDEEYDEYNEIYLCPSYDDDEPYLSIDPSTTYSDMMTRLSRMRMFKLTEFDLPIEFRTFSGTTNETPKAKTRRSGSRR